MLKTILLKSLFALLLLIAILCGSLTWICTTNSGLQAAVKLSNHLLPGQLHISTLQGSLSNEINANKVNYKSDTIDFTADTLTIDWHLLELLHKKIFLNKIFAKNIKVKIQGSTQQITPKTKKVVHVLQEIAFLHDIHINNLKLQNITINNPKLPKPIQLNSIDLSLVASKKHENKLHADIISPLFHSKIEGTLNGHAKLKWQLNIPELNKLFANYHGTLHSDGIWAIHHKRTILHSKLTINNLKTPLLFCTNLSGKIDIDPRTKKHSTLELITKDVHFPNYRINQLALLGIFHFTNDSLSQIDLNLQPLAVVIPIQNNKQTINIQSSNLVTTFSKQGLKTIGKLNIAGAKPIQLNFELPKYQINNLPKTKQKIAGNINWQTENLTALSLISPQISKAQGKLDCNLKLQGTLEKPKIFGHLQLQNGSLHIEKFNIRPKNIILNATSNGKDLTYDLKTTSAKGTLNIAGKTQLTNPNLATELKINGNNFLASNTRLTYLRFSPDLTLHLDTKQINITGKIVIPKAYLRSNHDSDVITIPDDVTFVRSDAPTSKPLNIYTEVELILGKDVRINMLGLKGLLGGQLKIKTTSKTTTTANGILTLRDGYYTIYGQELKVSKGSALHFANSPIDNPHLNVHIYRIIRSNNQSTMGNVYLQSKQRTVKMHISGKAKKPKIELSSDPADISNTDIFSYLILGQSSSNASGDTTQLLLKAANALNPGGPGELNHIVGNLRKGLGLSELSLESSTVSDGKNNNQVSTNTSLVLGKYLSPRLYLSYSYGILEPMNIFRVTYFMGRKWSVQTETSSKGRGIDILYHIGSATDSSN